MLTCWHNVTILVYRLGLLTVDNTNLKVLVRLVELSMCLLINQRTGQLESFAVFYLLFVRLFCKGCMRYLNWTYQHNKNKLFFQYAKPMERGQLPILGPDPVWESYARGKVRRWSKAVTIHSEWSGSIRIFRPFIGNHKCYPRGCAKAKVCH